MKCLGTARCECRLEVCVNQWPIPKELLIELKVLCTVINLLFLCCFAMGCGGSVVGHTLLVC